MTPLYGQDAAVAAFRTALDAGTLHHAWLLTGPAGVGKASFADRAALRVLADAAGPRSDRPGIDIDAAHPAAKLIEAGSHPDLMRLERLAKNDAGELARSITVDQVRGLARLFATTASLSPWRAVVIDAIDDLEPAGANALLKSLEEPPPHSLFLLVSHAPERLLPTIRSRCRQLRFALLDDDAMAPALRGALPDAEEGEIAGLVAAGAGSPGRAVAWRGLDIDRLDRDLATLAAKGDPTNSLRSALVQKLAPKSAQPRYEAFLARVPGVIAAAARDRRGAGLAEALGLWERASRLAGRALRNSLDPQATAFELAGMLAALAPKSDPRPGHG